MSNLLSAYFSRLWREKIFWIALAFMGGCGIFFTVIQHITHKPYLGILPYRLPLRDAGIWRICDKSR